MNQPLAQRFAELLAMQSDDREVFQELLLLSPNLADGYCLYSLYSEWRQAFSGDSPRLEALEPLRALARFVNELERDDPIAMYAQPEWRQLVELRGPFEGMQTVTCDHCGNGYPSFLQSGFDDRYPSVCDKCGNVWLQSGQDDRPIPACECGGTFHAAKCPKCGCPQGKRADVGSTYQYFASHSLRVRTLDDPSDEREPE